MRRVTIILLLAVLIISFFVVEKFKVPQKEKHHPVAHITSHELSSQENRQIRDGLFHILEEQNPRVALAALREKASSSEAISRSCHDLVHEIGHEAYEKYHDFGKAMQYQDDLCNSGYLHGIIESHFAEANDIFATMQTVCSSFSPTKFIGWECFHGVGHGLMYFTENDLPKSLSLCDSYSNADARKACINGVFMENFNVDQEMHVSKYVRTDSFYPCTEQKTQDKTDCYLYAPTYYLKIHKNDYDKALDWCKTAEEDFRLICTTGVGSQAMKEHIASPKYVESVCMQGSTDETKACIQGMIGLYINHFGDLKEAKQLCNKLGKSNIAACEQTIASTETLF